MVARPKLCRNEDRYLAFGIPSLDQLLGCVRPREAPAGSDRPYLGFALSESLAEEGGRARAAESATFCIIGPDGTGKSLFALHLASDYWRRTCSRRGANDSLPRIIYASTDFSYDRAARVWQTFWLDRPWSRSVRIPYWLDRSWSDSLDIPYETAWVRADTELAAWELREHKKRLLLTHYSPAGEADLVVGVRKPLAAKSASLAQYLVDDRGGAQVAFLDLESTTSGDDWAFLHKILAVLPVGGDRAPRHLMVIDAVEGLETLVGERDAFGQRQSRRARIAQLVRAAAGKCHVVFVVEEPKDGQRLPEVFVSDTVIRLRSTIDRDYARRTVEFEKVRGQQHIRGQHDFQIREKCSRTGDVPNPDEPEVGWSDERNRQPGEPMKDPMAYIQVLPSLHYLTRDVSKKSPEAPEWTDRDWQYAGFGIYQLDAMLWRARDPDYPLSQAGGGGANVRRVPYLQPEGPAIQLFFPEVWKNLLLIDQVERLPNCLTAWSESVLPARPSQEWDDAWMELCEVREDCVPNPFPGFDRMGLPAGRVTTLIGNDSTYKSQLSRAFLSQCFRTRHILPAERRLPTHFRVIAANEKDPLQGTGLAVLLATYDTDSKRLAESLRSHLIAVPKSERKGQENRLANHLIVRRLEPHHLPPAVLVHVIQQAVLEAKRLLHQQWHADPPLPNDRELRRLDGRIRLVIDDWSTILAMYPEVKRDPLVLPYLVDYLRGQGVTTLILATRSGNPADHGTSGLEQDIRELLALADYHLYTWHVPFFGERRVALTIQPSPEAGVAQVRELRRARGQELPLGRLVDPESPPNDEISEKAVDDENEHPDKEALFVDPHFELYLGLHEGQPATVPIEVRLFAEREGIPAFQHYLQELQYLLHNLFAHDRDHTVIHPLYGADYEQLRELSYLQSETRLNRTVVLQVDEFWAESRSELRRQDRYLNARTVDLAGKPIRAEDPFGLFQLTAALLAKWKIPPEALATSRGKAPNGPAAHPRKRVDFFDLIGYDCRKAAQRYPVEKVPYSWDFGFLVCDAIAWHRAFDVQDHRTARVRREHAGAPPQQQTVKEIWNRLWKIGPRPDMLPGAVNIPPIAHWNMTQRHMVTEPREGLRPTFIDVPNPIFCVPSPGQEPTEHGWWQNQYHDDPVSWREFFGACKTIAKAARFELAPFDADLLATESFSCLVLEIWLSEVFQSIMVHRQTSCEPASFAQWQWLPPRTREEAYWDTLAQLLYVSPDDVAPRGKAYSPIYRRALYRTMLLLDEMFQQSQLSAQDRMLVSRPAAATAVAARHWYSSAALAMQLGNDARGRILVGLPGHYAVRGDWFLAVAKGSRSARLGERAMDILCSRRGNVTRLQAGLGLPVRDLHTEPPVDASRQARGEFWTSLRYIGPDNTEHKIPYKDLRQLGAFDPQDLLGRAANFHWLWRSTISSYDVHARIWQRWLVYLFEQWRTWRPAHARVVDDIAVAEDQAGKPWWDGFAEYDYCLRVEYSRNAIAENACYVDTHDNPRWEKFVECCDALIESLGRASL